MSEGTPGHGPDADSRTGSGDGQAPADGRPAVPPVRYGPRNGSPANGTQSPGSTGRTSSGPSAPQQYRPPQPPRTPATGPGANGTNGAGTNGRSNGAGANGSHPVTPNPYARPRPNAAPARPEPSEQERLVAEARTAAAARNASASKVRGGSALSGTRSPAVPQAASDETTVMPVVAPRAPTPAVPAGPDVTTSEETVAPEKGRNVLGRLRDGRDRRASKDPQAPEAEASEAGDTTVVAPAPAATEQEPRTEPAAVTPEATETTEATEQEPATEERRLTWRDRLGLAPKEPRSAPTASPETVPEAPTDAAATTPVAAVSAQPEARTPPTGAPTTGQPGERVTPTALAPSNGPDTAVIPAVEGESAGAPATAGAPVAAGAAQTAASARPKVGAARRTRKARLRLSRVDPWSVMKTALLFSIAAGIILVVATYGVWSVLNASGLFDAVNDMVKSVVSTPGDTTPFRIEEYVNTQKIIGVAALIAVVDVLIFTALATLGSFLYNLAATVLGGLEVTLAED